MFGYVQIRKPEMKIKDYEIYHGFYCGLCYILKKKYGFLGQMTLTYDMTFLIILLSSVYDVNAKKKNARCIVHPGRKHTRLYNEITEYAADINIMLSYYHFKDDVEDEKSKKAFALMKLYSGKNRRVKNKYKTKQEIIEKNLNNLSVLEKNCETDIIKLADCFGQIMRELFEFKNDVMGQYLSDLGYHLGRYIYIMDAYDDFYDDKKSGQFNPFSEYDNREKLETEIEKLLLDEISKVGEVFMKLPCIEYKDILGNIIYAGVWNRFDKIREDNKDKREE